MKRKNVDQDDITELLWYESSYDGKVKKPLNVRQISMNLLNQEIDPIIEGSYFGEHWGSSLLISNVSENTRIQFERLKKIDLTKNLSDIEL